ncbi:hypothetical protein [uncultured Jatrophihabitans sp.]|uniref:hypothetical protein n=1 Tax=uncultured Jatrophihabitans sp. TaxID=1610747 RepID=UPI0035CA2B98
MNALGEAEQGEGPDGEDAGGDHGNYVPMNELVGRGAYQSSLTITLADGTVLSPAEVHQLRRSQRREQHDVDVGYVDLSFPTDRIVGVLDWNGSWDTQTGPVLATGVVRVPDDGEVQLKVSAVSRTEPAGDGWQIITEPGDPAVDLGFLNYLAPNIIGSISLGHVDASSFSALRHLAPGLRKLYLTWSGLGDEVLADIAALRELTWLQTFGNRFTDVGVQQLAALTQLRSLYLEEETLTAAAFAFTAELPLLERLGVQDVPLTADDLAFLKLHLPGVDVG